MSDALPSGRPGLPAEFLVRGRYVEFTVVSETFGIKNYTFTGAANPRDMTGGRRTVAFASKTLSAGEPAVSALPVRRPAPIVRVC